MILKSEPYNFHRLDLTRQAAFIVTIDDEDGLRLTRRWRAQPPPAFGKREIVDGRLKDSRSLAGLKS